MSDPMLKNQIEISRIVTASLEVDARNYFDSENSELHRGMFEASKWIYKTFLREAVKELEISRESLDEFMTIQR